MQWRSITGSSCLAERRGRQQLTSTNALSGQTRRQLDLPNQPMMPENYQTNWTFSTSIPIPKSGDLTSTDNYRGISLRSDPAKGFSTAFGLCWSPSLRPQQNSFQEKRTTVKQVLALRRIIEGVQNRNLQAIMPFIDFKIDFFDTIHQGKLISILRAYGIPDKLVQASISKRRKRSLGSP